MGARLCPPDPHPTLLYARAVPLRALWGAGVACTMAKAGARYEVETGNIWGYAHRGDLTGVRAALERGVQPNLLNVAGWSACHAAAAAGQTKVISCLLKAGADVELRDRGGRIYCRHRPN